METDFGLRLVSAVFNTYFESYDEGDAVTIYSESLATGENRFPMSSVTGAHAPFGRSAGFTNSIHDPVKKHAEACDEIDQVSLEYLKVTHALK